MLYSMEHVRTQICVAKEYGFEAEESWSAGNILVDFIIKWLRSINTIVRRKAATLWVDNDLILHFKIIRG